MLIKTENSIEKLIEKHMCEQLTVALVIKEEKERQNRLLQQKLVQKHIKRVQSQDQLPLRDKIRFILGDNL